MDLLDLVNKLTFKVADKPIQTLDKRLEGINHRLEFLGAAEVARGLFHLVEKFSGLGESLQASATSAGITTDELQKLQYAGSMSAVSAEEMGTALTHLTRELQSAKEGGGEAIKQFADLGISREQLAGFRTGKDAMMAMADAVQRVDDPTKRLAITTGLLGRGSSKMVGFLAKGSAAIRDMGMEAQDLGAVLSGPQVQALADVEDSLSQLWQVFRTFMAGLAAQVAPAIQNIVGWMLNLYKANRAFIQVRLDQWFQNITYAMGFVYGVVEALVLQFMRFAKEHEEIVEWAGYLALGLGALAIAGAAVSAVMGIISGILGAISILFSPVVLGVGALVLAIHDLWTILSGGSWEDTWLYKMLNGAKAGVSWMADKLGLGGGGEGAGDSDQEFVDGILGAHADLAALQGMAAPGASVPTFLNPASGAVTNVDMNSPITINIPAGTDPRMVGQAAKDGVREHLDQLSREMRRSLKPAQAY